MEFRLTMIDRYAERDNGGILFGSGQNRVEIVKWDKTTVGVWVLREKTFFFCAHHPAGLRLVNDDKGRTNIRVPRKTVNEIIARELYRCLNEEMNEVLLGE